jgi:hypothetical protein
MIRQIELHRCLGRRLVSRLVRAAWIAPTRIDGGVFYSAREVHKALTRLQRGDGYLLEPRFKAPAENRESRANEWPCMDSLPADLFAE